MGQLEECCRYLVMGCNGFECLKISPEMKQTINDKWAVEQHVAQGDNCSGRSDLSKEKTEPNE